MKTKTGKELQKVIHDKQLWRERMEFEGQDVYTLIVDDEVVTIGWDANYDYNSFVDFIIDRLVAGRFADEAGFDDKKELYEWIFDNANSPSSTEFEEVVLEHYDGMYMENM